MQLDDLPRLSDEERDAIDDGYTAVEGVAAPAAPVPFGSGPMPGWLVATLVSATIVLVLLVLYAFKLGKAERAKTVLAEPQELDQEHWAAYQKFGEPPSNLPSRPSRR